MLGCLQAAWLDKIINSFLDGLVNDCLRWHNFFENYCCHVCLFSEVIRPTIIQLFTRFQSDTFHSKDAIALLLPFALTFAWTPQNSAKRCSFFWNSSSRTLLSRIIVQLKKPESRGEKSLCQCLFLYPQRACKIILSSKKMGHDWQITHANKSVNPCWLTCARQTK